MPYFPRQPNSEQGTKGLKKCNIHEKFVTEQKTNGGKRTYLKQKIE